MKSIRSIDKEGTIHYKNKKGQYHREDGPAYEQLNGYKEWLINGLLHREDGPAIEYSDGDIDYYLYGNYYSKDDWQKQIIKTKLERIKDL